MTRDFHSDNLMWETGERGAMTHEDGTGPKSDPSGTFGRNENWMGTGSSPNVHPPHGWSWEIDGPGTISLRSVRFLEGSYDHD